MMLRPTVLVLALAASSFAWSQALDPPERVARLSYAEGQVAFQDSQSSARSALPDRPLIPGDHLITEAGGRLELTLGTAAIRLDENTELTFVGLDEATVWVELNAGTANVILHELLQGEMFEIVTPNTAIALREPGEYRVEVQAHDSTQLTVRAGTAEVETAAGPVPVTAGQRVQLEGRDALARLAAAEPQDAFDEWVLSRERQLDEMESRYAMQDDAGYDELDNYGEWYDDSSYGRVWLPSYAYGGWDPFRHGRWERDGYGWAWVNPLPWSAFTFHSGRWAYLHHLSRWCWTPGSRDHSTNVARVTHPFGHLRGAVRVRTNGDQRGDQRFVAGSNAIPRQADRDRRTAARPASTSGGRTGRGTMVRSSGGNQSQPRQIASAPRSGSTTMRPSGSSSSFSSSRSSNSTIAASSRSASRSATPSRTTRAFGTPQQP